MPLIDSHCHLDFNVFDADRDAVVDDAVSQGIEHIIVPSVSSHNWQQVADIQQRYSIAHVAYGMHPMFMHHHQLSDLAELRTFLENNNPIAVGECGLDFFIKEAHSQQHRDQQIIFFKAQLALADEFSLPVIIHARKSLDVVLKYIRQLPNLRGVIHSFSGSRQQAEVCIEQGFMLGFGGPITYTRATKLRKLVTELPLQSLLLETDAPDQPDSDHYGQRNVPANIKPIAEAVAELRSCDISEVTNVTTANAKRLFQLTDLL